MSDEDYVEGDQHSESADAPETGEPAARDAKQGGIDSSSPTDAPVQRTNRAAHRTAAARKAFAEAVVASKAAAAAKPPTELDELDPEAPMVPEAKPLTALTDIAKAKAAAADAPPAAAEAPKPTPPAPSLDPEVRKLREEIKRERETLAAERAELEKSRAVKPAEAAAPTSAPDLEAYLDNAPSWLRGTFEAMRADKMTDEEFKSEVADLITMLSGDVLGVPLPENVRIKLEAAQAKKMVRTHKTLQTRKEQEAKVRMEREQLEATTKAETERVEQEWSKASQVLSQQFSGAESAAAKAHPWLAAEDEPGKIIVDVIRAAVTKDGTQLSWQEAAKQANDYLKVEAEKYYGKRSALLGATKPAAAPAAKPAAAVPAPAPAPAKSAVVTTPTGNQKWSRERHMENTKAAFRAMIAGKPE